MIVTINKLILKTFNCKL